MPRLHNMRCAYCSQDLSTWLMESSLNTWDHCPMCGAHVYMTDQGLKSQEARLLAAFPGFRREIDTIVCLYDVGRLGLDVAFVWRGNDLVTTRVAARVVGMSQDAVVRRFRSGEIGGAFKSPRAEGAIRRGQWLVPRNRLRASHSD